MTGGAHCQRQVAFFVRVLKLKLSCDLFTKANRMDLNRIDL